MILFDLTNGEADERYQSLEASNSVRHYHFLESVIDLAINMGRPFLSQSVLKALNYHAITCLHAHPGAFRPCDVAVGHHRPPPYWQVQSLMDDFVNQVNWMWEKADPIWLAAHVLWRLNYIHPFINGNGRTARAACYFVLCAKAGGLLPGSPILPQLMKNNRQALVDCLRKIDVGNDHNLDGLTSFISSLLEEQLVSAGR